MEEPKCLTKGKRFHREVQKDWEDGPNKAKGMEIAHEEVVTKPSERKGRIDVIVNADGNLMAVVEVKCTDWNKMTLQAVRRNVNRQASQIWDYIESQLQQGKDVSPGIIFPQIPKDPQRAKLIEALFDARGIPVVWNNESSKDRKARH